MRQLFCHVPNCVDGPKRYVITYRLDNDFLADPEGMTEDWNPDIRRQFLRDLHMGRRSVVTWLVYEIKRDGGLILRDRLCGVDVDLTPDTHRVVDFDVIDSVRYYLDERLIFDFSFNPIQLEEF